MLTYTAANTVINNLVGRTATGGPTSGTVYIGLSSTAPTRYGQNVTEPPAANGYTRTLLSNYNVPATVKMQAAEIGVSQNSEIIYCGEVVNEAWPTITHVLFFTTPTGGVPYMYGELTTPLTPGLNTVPIIRAGDLKVMME